MSDNTLKYPRGTALIFTTGEYSDYSVDATLVTIKDCDLPALAQQFAKENRRKTDWSAARPNMFGSWLVVKGYAMPMDAQTVHLGNYGEFEPEFGIPEK